MKRTLLRVSGTMASLYLISEHIVSLHMIECTGPSMAPTVQLTGDIAVVDRWSNKPIQRGEVVAFLSPKDPEKLLMKRVYGLPGDDILVNGELHRVEGGLWVEGDNRSNSHDSRDFGPVHFALIKGRIPFKIGLNGIRSMNPPKGQQVIDYL